MNVLIIPEDFRKDQYILKPIVEAMFRSLGRARVNVRVCQEPLLGGIDQALRWERMREIFVRYKGMVQVFLHIVDRDCNVTRRAALDALEQQAITHLPKGRIFLSEHAWQELEVWTLAGHELPPIWPWTEVRAERDPKERFFLPFAQSRGLMDEPGQGRKTLSLEAAARYPRLRQLCPEDLGALEQRLDRALTAP